MNTTSAAGDLKKEFTNSFNWEFAAFVFSIMLTFAVGFILLNIEFGDSAQAEIEIEASQTYKQHRDILDEISKKYSRELSSVRMENNIAADH